MFFLFFYFEESQISATEKKNKAISLGNSHQEVIGHLVSRLVTGLKKTQIGSRRRVDFTTLTSSQAFVTREESLRTTA